MLLTDVMQHLHRHHVVGGSPRAASAMRVRVKREACGAVMYAVRRHGECSKSQMEQQGWLQHEPDAVAMGD